MFKKTRIFSSLVLCFSILLSGSISHAEESKVTEEQKQEIMNVYHYDRDMVDNLLPDHELKKLFDRIPSVVSVSKEEKYIQFVYDVSDPTHPMKISEKEAPKQEFESFTANEEARNSIAFAPAQVDCGSSAGYDCISESWLTLETWVVKSSSSSGFVSSRFFWHTSPFWHQIDVHAIGLNTSFSPVPGTEYGIYKYSMGTYWQNYERTIADKRDSGGYAFKWNLDSQGIAHQGYMSYDIVVNNSGAVVSDAYSHYAHQERILGPISPSITIPWGGAFALTYATEFSYMHGHAQTSW